MKKYFYTLVFAILFSSILYSNNEVIKIAVSEFETLTADAERKKLGVESSKIIENGFAKLNRFEVRKTGAIKKYTDKLALSQLGLINPDSVKGMGKSLRINYLTVGSVASFGSQYEVDLRTVDIDKWEIVHSSGCTSFSIRSSLDYIISDISITFFKEDIEKRGKEYKDDGKSTISVYRFSDDNIMAQSTGYGGVFSEMLNSELGALNEVSVIERIYSKKLINEKSLEMAGVIENDNSDSYFLLRGVAYKLLGNFKVFKDLICINYSVVNTKSHMKVLMGHTEIASLKAMRPIARHIAKLIEDTLNNKIGSLKLISKPNNAELFIDGEPSGITPVIMSLKKGEHYIRVTLPGYETINKKINIMPNKMNVEVVKPERISRKLLMKAFAYEKRMDWEEAVEMYRQFIKKYNDTLDANQAYYRMGHIQQLYMKKYKEAIKTFQTLIDRYPDAMTRAEAYYGLAKTYNEMGNKKKSKEIVRILIEKYSDSFAAEEASKIFE